MEKYGQRLVNNSQQGPALAWAQSMQDLSCLGFFILQRMRPRDFMHPSNSLGHILIPAYPAPSSYKNTWPRSFGTATSFTYTFGKIRYTPKRRQGPLLRFKNATFMPLTLLTGILTSCCKKRQQMIYQRWFSYMMTRSAYSRNWKKNMRVVFKYSFPIYTELQKIFKTAPQFSGLGPATSSLPWPLLALRQPKDAGGPCLQATNASLSPALWSSTGQLAEYCTWEPRWWVLAE